MSDPHADTPLQGSLRPGPQTDKFQLALIVTRLEAEIEALKSQIDCLEESDARQDKEINDLGKNLAALTTKVSGLVEQIKGWRAESQKNDANHAKRLGAIERRVSGFGGVLILLQGAFEIWKAAHGH